ncbi:MAG: alpha-glucan family phosphorylase [Desulfobacterales bacterium]
MSTLKTYQVYPRIPKRLEFLETLARNMWWCWRLDAIELFRRVDPRLWERSGRNPIVFATMLEQERFERGARDEGFLAHLDRVQKRFEEEIKTPVDYSQTYYGHEKKVAYFSMEFGVHESLPYFSGGLGVLAGDHLKAASDLKIPMVAIGLLYKQGYFHQYLDHDGWQQEEYPETDIFHLPVNRAKDTSGQEMVVTVDRPEGPIHAQVWVVKVGRIPLYLLDTNMAENPPEIREITARLYAGESSTRLAQEMLLGIGGMKVLEQLNIYPNVCHMNEGHCAFVCIERMAQVMKTWGVDVKTAMEIVPRTMVFTTHTPVAAGHDEFPAEMVRPYMESYEKKLDTPVETILSWGQPGKKFDPQGKISMFVLALTFSQFCNGVSRLHGNVARQMWHHVWPDRPVQEVPISHVTNGIHIPSWISIENHMLFERYLGPDWYINNAHNDLSQRIDQIYNEELWRAREMSRSRLVRTCRAMMVRQQSRRNAPKAMIEEAESVLDPEILTIGFARRFTSYKRAYLLFMDPERLEGLIKSKNKPVQFVFAGKAHPKDNEGKDLIRQVVQFSRRPGMRNRIVFLEDYDISIARQLVQGVDVWLNTPRRPLEACGTSGMKAAVNGVLNLSILDGWWDEGYCDKCGWAIGNGEQYQDNSYQDEVEARALYNILENDVIPTFYDRREGDTPDRWTEMMKESMKLVLKNFCAHSMVKQYENDYYLPAVENHSNLTSRGAEAANSLVAQRRRLRNEWPGISIKPPESDISNPSRVGDTIRVTTEVHLAGLRPEEVEVELYYGHLKTVDELTDARITKMEMTEDLGGGNFLYECRVTCEHAGRFGFTTRVLPKGDDYLRHTPGFLIWA